MAFSYSALYTSTWHRVIILFFRKENRVKKATNPKAIKANWTIAGVLDFTSVSTMFCNKIGTKREIEYAKSEKNRIFTRVPLNSNKYGFICRKVPMSPFRTQNFFEGVGIIK